MGFDTQAYCDVQDILRTVARQPHGDRESALIEQLQEQRRIVLETLALLEEWQTIRPCETPDELEELIKDLEDNLEDEAERAERAENAALSLQEQLEEARASLKATTDERLAGALEQNAGLSKRLETLQKSADESRARANALAVELCAATTRRRRTPKQPSRTRP